MRNPHNLNARRFASCPLAACLALLSFICMITARPNSAEAFIYDRNHPLSPDRSRFYMVYEGGYEFFNFEAQGGYKNNDLESEMLSYGAGLGYRLRLADMFYNLEAPRRHLYHRLLHDIFLAGELTVHSSSHIEGVSLAQPAEDIYLHTDFTLSDKLRVSATMDTGYFFTKRLGAFMRIGYGYAHPRVDVTQQYAGSSASSLPGNELDNPATLTDAREVSDIIPSHDHYDETLHSFIIGGGTEFLIGDHLSLRFVYSHKIGYHRSGDVIRTGILWRF